MKRLFIVVACALALVACSKVEPADTVESLVANPDRLKALRAQCKADHARMGDTLCNLVSEATRRRFMGNGKTPYTKDRLPSPAPPVSPSSSAASKD